MKKLILIAVIFGAISCTKTTTTTATTTTTGESALLGTYNVKGEAFNDEALTIANGTSDGTLEIKLINNKYAIDFIAFKDTFSLTDIKVSSNEHIAFNLVTRNARNGSVYESLKKSVTDGVSYSGKYLKGTKENILFYFKASDPTNNIRYYKIQGDK